VDPARVGTNVSMTHVGVGRRFAALVVDGLVSLLWTIPLSHITTTSDPTSVTINMTGARGWIAFAVWFVYLTALEAGIGATLGKLALGIRVAREDGGRIDLGGSLVRNLARAIDGLPWIVPYLVGAIVVWNSPTKQRLGDRWAHTVVITRASRIPAPPVPISPPLPPPPSTRNPDRP
jgi:uncharacterized RDD family membrane protein YckC